MKCHLRIYVGGGEYHYPSFRSIRAARRFVKKIPYKLSVPASVCLFKDYTLTPIKHWELR
jgi:hypothetical protein